MLMGPCQHWCPNTQGLQPTGPSAPAVSLSLSLSLRLTNEAEERVVDFLKQLDSVVLTSENMLWRNLHDPA